MSNEQYFRRAHIAGDTGDSYEDVLSKLGQVPGYEVKEPSSYPTPDRAHSVFTPDGMEIRLSKTETPSMLTTSNVIGQDGKGYVSVQDDALTKLAKAAQNIDGMSVQVALSDHDLENL